MYSCIVVRYFRSRSSSSVLPQVYCLVVLGILVAMAMQLGNARPLFVGIPPLCSRLTCLQLMVRPLFQSQSLQNLSSKAVRVAGAGYHCQCHSQLIIPLIEGDSQQLAALASQWVPCALHCQHSLTTLQFQISLPSGQLP